ncbi:MAG: PVC-type heme-binding CxxCH protein [Chthoniobacteraceae bacterium]
MNPVNPVLLLAASAALAATPSPLSPDDALKSFEVADDLRVELFAAEPLVGSPCAIAFDAKGRMFVAENRGYPRMDNPPLGVIAMIEDTNGDGRMDKRTVFADGLTYPNGVMPWKDGLLVTSAPDVILMRDTNGDGVADEKRVLFTGFDTAKSTQLRVNAPRLGPDGWIYLAAGLSLGTIKCPEHPERPELKMTGDVRFHPDTLEIETVDGKSQFGQSFDDFGRRFICMNRLPVQHVVLSSKWLGRNPNFAFSETVQDCNERLVKTAMKGGGDGVQLFPISSNITTADSHFGSFSAACGIFIWRGGALPERYDGSAISCDPTANLIHADRLEPRGATFNAVPLLKGRELLASRDDWFRPVFVERGPDGALYVADMYRKVIEHPDYLPEEVRKHADFESGRNMGRIWRITAKTPRTVKPLAPFKDEFAPLQAAAKDTALAAKLANDPSARVRFCLALVLGDVKDDSAIATLAQIAARDAGDKWARAAVLSGIGGREPQFLRAVWPKLAGTSEGELELLGSLGRCFRDAAVLSEAMGAAEPGAAAGAIWSGFIERNSAKTVKDTPAFKKLLELSAQQVAQATVPAAQRLIFARLLATGTWDSAAKSLQAALAANPDEALRTALVRSLATLDANRAAEVLLAEGKWTTYSPGVRETVLAALVGRPTQLEGLLAAVEANRLPASAFTTQRRTTLLKHKDAAIRERAEKLFNAGLGDRAAALERAKQALTLTAKPAHGREIFRQLCATCHRLDREGVNVGPDLFDMRRQTKDIIVFHLVMPDAEIAPAFAFYSCEAKDGRAFAGLLVSETPTSVTIRMPGGLEETVLRNDIKTLAAMPGSLMPPGLDAAMQPQDIADLVAYLKGEQ